MPANFKNISIPDIESKSSVIGYLYQFYYCDLEWVMSNAATIIYSCD